MDNRIREKLEELIRKYLEINDYERAYQYMELRLTVARIDDLEKNR